MGVLVYNTIQIQKVFFNPTWRNYVSASSKHRCTYGQFAAVVLWKYGHRPDIVWPSLGLWDQTCSRRVSGVAPYIFAQYRTCLRLAGYHPSPGSSFEGYVNWSVGHVPELLRAATAGVPARPDQPSYTTCDCLSGLLTMECALRFQHRIPGDVV